jgi:DNA-binding NarL/FixJ family response regulator
MHINIAIAEDNPFALKSIQDKLADYTDIRIRLIASNGVDLLEKIKNLPIELVLMDIEMPVMNGIECTRKLRQQNAGIKVLALTTFDDDDKILEMIRAGAGGYLLKEESRETIYRSILDTLAGGAAMSASIALRVINLIRNPQPVQAVQSDFNLSKRETEVLEHLKNGLTYEQIGENLFISTGTIRKHIEQIYRKLQVNNKVSAINKAIENQLI